MTRVWRLCKERYAETAFDGEGIRRVGGRWNLRGRPVVYTSENLSLAALELLVHLDVVEAPPNVVAIPADVPDTLAVETLAVADVPDDWRRTPGHPELKKLGDTWLHSEPTAVMRVPSVVVPGESNDLINPEHAEFAAIEVGDPHGFDFDERRTATSLEVAGERWL